MLLGRFLLLFLVLVGLAGVTGATLRAETTAEARATQHAAQTTTAYTLPPEKLAKARTLARIYDRVDVASGAWSVVQLVLILQLGIAARMREVAARLTSKRAQQTLLFVLQLLLLTSVLDLPLEMYSHHVSLAYGLSVQRWPSWFRDHATQFAVLWSIASGLAMILFFLIRRSPTRWWLWFWMVAVVFSILGVFATPYLYDPLFNTFEPLAQSSPELVQRLEQVVARGGIDIPPGRMFLMKASAKTTGLNAYVTGFGASKRVVVWDTTVAKMTPDEIAFTFGHEMGHYVLGHIVSGLLFGCGLMLVFFWVGYHGMRLLLARFGRAWSIPSQEDKAALVVLLVVMTVLGTLAEPLANLYSRAHEHAADIYGQEVIHGIVPDPQATARSAFQVLGEESLNDPTPHPLMEFWTGSHPPIRTRAAFAEAYDPWAPGMEPKYFAR